MRFPKPAVSLKGLCGARKPAIRCLCSSQAIQRSVGCDPNGEEQDQQILPGQHGQHRSPRLRLFSESRHYATHSLPPSSSGPRTFWWLLSRLPLAPLPSSLATSFRSPRRPSPPLHPHQGALVCCGNPNGAPIALSGGLWSIVPPKTPDGGVPAEIGACTHAWPALSPLTGLTDNPGAVAGRGGRSHRR